MEIFMMKFFLAAFIMVFLLTAIHNIYPFLALNHPICAKILLIEGWLSYDYLPAVLEEFKRHGYNRIIVVGFENAGENEEDMKEKPTLAELKARRLCLLAGHPIEITVVSSRSVKINKTYTYLVGFKRWLARELPETKSVNLFSASVHARKSYMLLRRILPPSVNVGVISAPPLQYDPKYWWLSKKGLWYVFKNTISFINAFLFTTCKNQAC